jgi:hypothetical protein
MTSELAKPQDWDRDTDSWKESFEAAIISAMETQGRDFLAPRGLLPIFEHTRTMHGFDCVYASWRPAVVSYMIRMRGKKLLMAPAPQARATEFFFGALVGGKKERALSYNAPLIYERAKLGDVEFFNRFWHELAKRDRRRHPQKRLAMALLSAWLHGFLWLLSSQDRLALIEQFGFKGKVTLKGLEIARKRLGLKGYADFGPDQYPQAPFKLDYSSEEGFRLVVPD